MAFISTRQKQLYENNYFEELLYLLLIVSVDELMVLKKEIMIDPPCTPQLVEDDNDFPF